MDHQPSYGARKFRCLLCGVTSQQFWFSVETAGEFANTLLREAFLDYRLQVKDYQQTAIAAFVEHMEEVNTRRMPELVPGSFSVATCLSCGDISLWFRRDVVYPKSAPVAPPNDDMDAEVQSLYREAATIVPDSPKGAAALLRLALQLLLRQIGKPGDNINAEIGELVANGLSSTIQRALDLLRVVGNNAVHPGQINFEDDRQVALKLFQVLNFIANELITKPKELELLYRDVVPDATKKHIDRRDGKAD